MRRREFTCHKYVRVGITAHGRLQARPLIAAISGGPTAARAGRTMALISPWHPETEMLQPHVLRVANTDEEV